MPIDVDVLGDENVVEAPIPVVDPAVLPIDGCEVGNEELRVDDVEVGPVEPIPLVPIELPSDPLLLPLSVLDEPIEEEPIEDIAVDPLDDDKLPVGLVDELRPVVVLEVGNPAEVELDDRLLVLRLELGRVVLEVNVERDGDGTHGRENGVCAGGVAIEIGGFI